MNDEQTQTRPAQQIRMQNIKAAIWKNEGDNGPFYNVTFERLYRVDDQNDQGEWRSTSSFRRHDLLLLAKIADAAHSWIIDQHGDSSTHSAASGQQAAG